MGLYLRLHFEVVWWVLVLVCWLKSWKVIVGGKEWQKLKALQGQSYIPDPVRMSSGTSGASSLAAGSL